MPIWMLCIQRLYGQKWVIQNSDTGILKASHNMKDNNPIIEDHKQLTVLKKIGLELLQQLKAAMAEQPYASYFKNINTTEPNSITFTYLGLPFTTRLELFFNNTRLPAMALLSTYLLPDEKSSSPAEIVGYAYDMKYTVNHIYTSEDFAVPYLIELHQNLKKHYSDEHKPFPLKGIDK